MNATALSLVLATLLAPPAKTSTERSTRIYVRTTPPGASIILDGRQLGTSDGLFLVPPGVRKITLEMEGYHLEDHPVDVKEGWITRVEVQMVRKDGEADEGTHFGPVREVQFYDTDAYENRMIDFDTGKMFSTRIGDELDTEQYEAWLRENGIDAMTNGDGRLEPGNGMVVVERPESAWGKSFDDPNGAEIVRGELLDASTGSRGIGSEGFLPRTYYIETRAGGMGVLQVVERFAGATVSPGTDPMVGLRVRYRMIEDNGNPRRDKTLEIMREIEAAFENYRLDVGEYPSENQGPNALFMRPEDLPKDLNWRGPYYTPKHDPVWTEGPYPIPDAWDNPFRFVHVRGAEKPELWSGGPDWIFGNEDDLRSGGLPNPMATQAKGALGSSTSAESATPVTAEHDDVDVESGEKIQEARARMAAIEAAMQMYHLDTGRLLSMQHGFEGLLRRTDDIADPNRWKGPYLKTPEDAVPVDPWGNAYWCVQVGSGSDETRGILSFGPDGKSGTSDDLRSWNPVEHTRWKPTPDSAAGGLEFRVAATREEAAEFERTGKDLGWYVSLMEDAKGLVTDEQGERTRVLLWQTPEKSMAGGRDAEKKWQIIAVSVIAEPGRPGKIGVTFDEEGGRRLRELTTGNVNRQLAVLVDGRVVCCPTVRAAIGPRVEITGNFSKAELTQLATALQMGMEPERPGQPPEPAR